MKLKYTILYIISFNISHILQDCKKAVSGKSFYAMEGKPLCPKCVGVDEEEEEEEEEEAWESEEEKKIAKNERERENKKLR